MWRRQIAATSLLLPATCPTVSQHRTIVKLYTSFDRGDLKLVTQNTTNLPSAKPQFTSLLKGKYTEGSTNKNNNNSEQKQTPPMSWERSDSNDVLVRNTKESNGTSSALSTSTAGPRTDRPYVPLSEVARIELKGDYLMEGGLYFDALRCYGVATKGYEAAYRDEHHNQRAMIRIKLSRAFRMTQRLEAAKGNIEHALWILNNNPSPQLDLVCEALLELGHIKEAAGEKDAGVAYEDVMEVIDACHSYGSSHRLARILPRIAYLMNLHGEHKIAYYSPYNLDRVFLLGDTAMNCAEQYYRAAGDQEGVVRVLERRVQSMHKKEFDMRDTSGKMMVIRGHGRRKAHTHSGGPTPSEMLLFSPTIHQVYIDRSVTNNAPIGEEDTVMPGANRKVLDDGNPYRVLRKSNVTLPLRRHRVGPEKNSMSEIFEL